MQPEEDSSQQRQRDLLRRQLPDSSLLQALRVDLRPEIALKLELALALPAGLLLRVDLAVVAVVLAQGLSQAAAELLRPDSSALGQPDSCPRLPAALVPEAELAQAKPARTRVKRER